MQYGYATPFTVSPASPDLPYALLDAINKAGYDFVEPALSQIMLMNDADFNEFSAYIKSSGLAVNCCCSIFPADLRLLGYDCDRVRLKEYMRRAGERLAILNTHQQVMGSAGSRWLPRYMSWNEGLAQLADVITEFILPYLDQHGIGLLIEPIKRGEANFINTMAEGAELTQLVNKPNVRLLADTIHLLNNGEDAAELLTHLADIEHIHISERDRVLPVDNYSGELAKLLHAIKASGYNKSLSFETGASAGYQEIGGALSTLVKFFTV